MDDVRSDLIVELSPVIGDCRCQFWVFDGIVHEQTIGDRKLKIGNDLTRRYRVWLFDTVLNLGQEVLPLNFSAGAYVLGAGGHSHVLPSLRDPADSTDEVLQPLRSSNRSGRGRCDSQNRY